MTESPKESALEKARQEVKRSLKALCEAAETETTWMYEANRLRAAIARLEEAVREDHCCEDRLAAVLKESGLDGLSHESGITIAWTKDAHAQIAAARLAGRIEQAEDACGADVHAIDCSCGYVDGEPFEDSRCTIVRNEFILKRDRLRAGAGKEGK